MGTRRRAGDGIIGTYLQAAFKDPAVLAEIRITADLQQAAGTAVIRGVVVVPLPIP